LILTKPLSNLLGLWLLNPGDDFLSYIEKLIKTSLYDKLNQIAHQLINFWEIEFQQEVEHLSDPIPRTVFYSTKFPIGLPQTVKVGLDSLIDNLTNGADVKWGGARYKRTS
jgi:PIN domain nuclease of toxin-antitoxin system